MAEISAKCSVQVPSSSSEATRWRPGRVKWKEQAGQTRTLSSRSFL